MVTASEKGVVVGRIQFNDDDDVIDCTKMGRSGKNIPSYVDRVSAIRLDESHSFRARVLAACRAFALPHLDASVPRQVGL